MPLVTSAATYTLGVAKQTNETTIGTVATYDMPVFSADVGPHQSVDRLAVTDASAIAGDPFKTEEHAEGDFVIPAFENSLGTFLVGLWTLDTKTGAVDPFTHTFSQLGTGTANWLTLYTSKPDAVKETMEANQITGFAFTSGSSPAAPLLLNIKAYGKRPTVATYTVTTSNALADGFFRGSGASLKVEADSAVPVVVDYVQNFSITVDRGIDSIPTADSIFPAYLSAGLVTVNFTADLIFTSGGQAIDMYKATYYGTAAGTAPSASYPKGSLDFTFVHSVTAAHTFQLKIPAAWWAATPPTPDPAGGPWKLSIAGYGLKPSSGDVLQPVLLNAVSTAY